jgi:hypothetical protein
VNPALVPALECSVPIWIQQIKAGGIDGWTARVAEKREHWIEMIAYRGDVLQFGGGKKGEAAAAFNALAEALAHMAFVPGGVKFSGVHWEAKFDG